MYVIKSFYNATMNSYFVKLYTVLRYFFYTKENNFKFESTLYFELVDEFNRSQMNICRLKGTVRLHK